MFAKHTRWLVILAVALLGACATTSTRLPAAQVARIQSLTATLWQAIQRGDAFMASREAEPPAWLIGRPTPIGIARAQRRALSTRAINASRQCEQWAPRTDPVCSPFRDAFSVWQSLQVPWDRAEDHQSPPLK